MFCWFFLAANNLLYGQESFQVKIVSDIKTVSANNLFQVSLKGTSQIQKVYKGFLEIENGDYLSYRIDKEGDIIASIRSRDSGSVKIRVVPGKLISVDGLKNTEEDSRLEIKIDTALSKISSELKSFGEQKNLEKKGFDFGKILEKIGGFGGMGGILSSLLGGTGFGGGKNATGNSPSGTSAFPQSVPPLAPLPPSPVPASTQNTIPPGSETSVKNNSDGTKTVTVKTPDGKTVEKTVDKSGIVIKSETTSTTPQTKGGLKSGVDEFVFAKCGGDSDAGVIQANSVSSLASEYGIKGIKSPDYSGACLPVEEINFVKFKNNITLLYRTSQGQTPTLNHCTVVNKDSLIRINNVDAFTNRNCTTLFWMNSLVKGKIGGEIYALKPSTKVVIK